MVIRSMDYDLQDDRYDPPRRKETHDGIPEDFQELRPLCGTRPFGCVIVVTVLKYCLLSHHQ